MVFKRVALYIIFIIVFTANILAQSKEVTVEVEGTSLIEKNSSGYKKEALQEAFQKAVQIGLGNLYNTDVLKKNEWRLKTIVYNNLSNFVSGYKIVAEEKTTQVYKVKVSVVVDTGKLSDQINQQGLGMGQTSAPRILPLIAEKKSSGNVDSWWLETSGGFDFKKTFTDIEKAIATYMTERNFVLIDPYSHELSASVPQSYKYLQIKVPEAQQLGILFGVDLILKGYVATSCSTDAVVDKTSCETSLSLQVISVATGRIVASKKAVEKAESNVANEAKVISRAKVCKTVVESILVQLSQNWKNKSTKLFKVIVKNMNSYEKYKKFREVITGSDKTKGLTGMLERYQSSDAVVFEGEIRDNVDTVVRNLIANLNPDLNAVVLSKGDNSVEVELQ